MKGGGSELRSKQKIFSSIIKKFTHHKEFNQFCDLIDTKTKRKNDDEPLVTDFLFDEAMVQEFEGDSEKFVHDIVNIFRVYKKLNKNQNLILWNFVKDLLTESIGSVEIDEKGIVDSKDRLPVEIEPTSQPRESARRKSTPSEGVPQYELPAKESQKKKRKSQAKEIVAEDIEQLHEIESPPSKKSRKSKGNPRDDAISPEDQEHQTQMLEVIQTLSSTPAFHIFLEPVRIEDVPDYYDIIEYPMDLATMRTNVTSGKYNQNKVIEYAVDMRRIGMNCMNYNLPGSEIYKIAEDYLRTFEVLYQSAFKSRTKQRPAKALAPNEQSDSSLQTPQSKKKSEKKHTPKSVASPILSGRPLVDEKKLEQIKKFFKMIYNHALAEPFRYPVDVSLAPGYTDLIKRPMDLSQIKSNFEYYANSQVNKLIEFYSDLILIFDNCQTYNVDDSPLFLAAQELSDYTKKAFVDHFPGVISAVGSNPMDQKPSKSTSKSSKSSTKSDIPRTPKSTPHASSRTPKTFLDDYEDDEPGNILLPSSSKRPPRRDKQHPDHPSLHNISNLESKDLSELYVDDKDLNQLSLEKLIELFNLLQSSTAPETLSVQERCFHEAKKFFKQFQNGQDGCFYSNDLYTCISHGSIRSEPSWYSTDYLFPLGFVCRRDLVLSLHPQDESFEQDIDPLKSPHIQVTFTTEISEDEHGKPLFRLLVGDNILVLESDNVTEIWNKNLFETFGKPILQSLGQKFLRCRAILYYISTCDAIEPFLEELPLFSTKQYLKTIKAPMWLSEVYSRLMDGLYDNEFDFAWDMRLIFQNSMNYNEPKSEVYSSAQTLLETFDILFCQWIQNVEDFSVSEPATGLWDDWMSLKYFDRKKLPDTTESQEVCKVTGLTNSPEAELLFCVSCEDCYHPSVSDGGLSYEDEIDGQQQQLWRCMRCQKMRLALESNQWSGLLPAKRFVKTKIFKSYIYRPAPELGSGWVKATTSTKPGVGKFLSPLGYLFNSKEDAVTWMNEEKEMHEKLISDREEEFLTKLSDPKSHQKRKKKKNTTNQRANTRGKKRKQSSDVHDGDQESNHDHESKKEETQEDSMTLLVGKLPHLQYDGSRVLFSGLYECSDTLELKMTTFNPENIPRAGFSGLDDTIIHRLIEGLPGSNKCRKYHFWDSSEVIKNLLKTIRVVIDKKEQLSSANRVLVEKLLSERNYWRNLEIETRQKFRPLTPSLVNPPTPEELMQKYPQFEKNLCQLLIPLIPPEWKFTLSCEEIESAVQIWEFLHLLTPLVSHQVFGLLDIIKSLSLNATPTFPNPSSIIFDEICCLLTSVLLSDMTQHFFIHNDRLLQDFLSLTPINSITWPSVTYVVLFLTSNLRTGRKKFLPEEVLKMIHPDRCLEKELIMTREFVQLFLCHPSFHSKQGSPFTTEENLKLDQFYSKIHDLIFLRSDDTFVFLDEMFAMVQEFQNQELVTWFLQLLNKYVGLPLEKFTERIVDALKNCPPSPSSDLLHRAVHENLAHSLPLLRAKEPDYFTIFDKIVIMKALIQYCCATGVVSSQIQKISAEITRSPLSEDPLLMDEISSSLESEIHPVEVPKSAKHSLKCLFSGIESKIDSSIEWVTVPASLLAPPVMKGTITTFGEEEDGEEEKGDNDQTNPNEAQAQAQEEIQSESEENVEEEEQQSNDIPKLRLRKKPRTQTDDSVTLKLRVQRKVCIKTNLIKFALARKLAASELENLEEPTPSSFLKASLNSNTQIDYVTKSELLTHTPSLGFDRTGREYWLLDEQNRTLVGGFNQTYSQYIDDEPVLLVREPSINTWSYICTSSVHELLDYLSPKHMCERFLFKNISSKIEKIQINISKTDLKTKCSQDPWLAGFRSFEFWFSGVQAMITNSANPLDTPRCLKLQELGIARCMEFRLGTHYAFINKIFDPTPEGDHNAQKKLSRNKLLEQVYDCHASLGWLRHDSYERVRELSANTIATKLLCDPTLYEFYSMNMRKTPFRKNNTHFEELGLNPRAYIKSASSTVHTRRSSTLLNSKSHPTDFSDEEDEEALTHHSGSASSKSVEQLHIETGQVLRRWPSGTKAASVLGVSRSGISICCSGNKGDAFGFRWRFCEGNNLPPIEEVSIKTILKMKACYQKSTGTYVGLDEDEEVEEEVLKPSTVQAPRPPSIQSLLPKSSQNVHRQVPDVVASTVSVPYRLLKLKIELLNLVAILPKGLLTWNPEDKKKKEMKGDKQDSGDDEKNDSNAKEEKENVKEEEQPSTADPETVEPESSESESETEMTTEKFVQDVQKCDTYGKLFKLIQLLEGALPLVALFDYPFHSSLDFTNAPLTSAMVATYLYSLDRWIRYEDIPLDFYYESVNYRPRLVYSPRCALSPICLKYFHHTGRCDPAISVGDSRYRELLPKGMLMPNQGAKQILANQFQKSLPPAGMMASLQQKHGQAGYGSGNLSMPMMMRPDPGVFTLDSIQPYVPKKEELKESVWV